MIRIISKFITRGNNGTSLGPFIFLKDKSKLTDWRLINHETIHFYQQLELFFIFQWILYGIFYLIQRLKGKTHVEAYRLNPFEREAFENDDNLKYLFQRKLYSWIKYVN